MTLTPKQAAQVAKAPPSQKKALRAQYKAQKANAPAPPWARPAAAKQEHKERPSAKGPKPARKAAIPNFLDPLVSMPAPTILSDGKALPHSGLVSVDFAVGTTNTTILLTTNTGDSGTVGIVLNVDASGAYVDGLQVLTLPTLALSDIAGGASSSRAMKFSVSVVNCSNALKRGGRVTYLNSSQRLPPITSGNYGSIVAGIKNSPYRRRVTGDTLARAMHLIGYPVDTIAYASFSPHRGTLSHDVFCDHVLGASVQNSPAARPMSVVAYVFDPVADQQDYSVTIRASFYTRWPLTSVPGQSMRNIPTADARVINAVHDHAEAKANDLAHIIEGGVIATAAPKVAGLARAAGGGVFNRMGAALGRGAVGAVEAAEGFAVDAFGAEGAALAEAGVALLA